MTASRPGEVLGLDRVPVRVLVRDAPLVWLPLAPGDRPIVVPGEAVPGGGILAERVRGPVVVDVPASAVPDGSSPGSWWEDDGRRRGLRRARSGTDEGELLYRRDGEWGIVTGDRGDVLEAPVPGIVREVVPGVGIALETASRGIVAAGALGGPARGRLEVVGDGRGELRPGSLDVGRAGAIVVAGSRVDAEMLTRARAMGIRGTVSASVPSRDLRGISASEERQRASLQPMAPFAVLVLEGSMRAPIPSPLMAIFDALAGQDVAIVGDPPLLLFDAPRGGLPAVPSDLVRVRHGGHAGREGRWVGPAGRRRFAAGVHLEAGFVALEAGDRGGSGQGGPADAVEAIPLADLERFA